MNSQENSYVITLERVQSADYNHERGLVTLHGDDIPDIIVTLEQWLHIQTLGHLLKQHPAHFIRLD